MFWGHGLRCLDVGVCLCWRMLRMSVIRRQYAPPPIHIDGHGYGHGHGHGHGYGDGHGISILALKKKEIRTIV